MRQSQTYQQQEGGELVTGRRTTATGSPRPRVAGNRRDGYGA